jgi:filamentous hemagglutinin family protein
LLLTSSVCVSGVVPDGSSDTQVSIDSSGTEVVDIAPANAERISHNRYSRFDVDQSGLLLNNRLSAARTIINEVTSADVSDINGDIRVQGTRAHVIIANPNGINVNGSTFYNVGGVALTTGSVGYVTRPTPLGGTQDNPLVSLGDGQINVGAGGISGVMNRLDLVSKKIRIEGNVHNEHESPFSSISVLAGAASVEFNPNLSIADAGGVWYDRVATPELNDDSFAVDITRPASIMASSLKVMVTDEGAGVRILGDAVAAQNNFTISADGHVQIEGALAAAGHFKVNSSSVEVNTTGEQQAKLESQNGALTINTVQHLNNLGGLLSGVAQDPNDDDSLAGVTLNVGSVFTQSTLSDLEYQRGITFSLTNIDVNAQQVDNHAGRLFSNSGISIDADIFNNTVVVADVKKRGEVINREYLGRRLWYTLFTTHERVYETSINYGEPVSGRFASELIANTGDINVNVNTLNSIGGDITVNEGSLFVNADVINHEAALAGRAKLVLRCELGGCNRDGFSTIDLVGGKWQASGNIELNASQYIKNVGGTFLAINDLVMTSPLISTASVETVDVLVRDAGLRSLFLHNDALWVQADQGGALLANMGRLVIDSDETLVVDGGIVDAGGGIESNVDINIVREPTSKDLYIRRHGGVLADVF